MGTVLIQEFTMQACPVRLLRKKRPGWMSGPPSCYAEYAIPYIASFDREFVLGLKQKGDDPFRTQYMLVSILPRM